MLDETHIRQLLERVAAGEQTIDEAVAALRAMPVEDLGFAKIDHHRALRTGFAEVVYCEPKTPDQVAAILQKLAAHSPQLLGTRATNDHYEAARRLVPQLHYHETARAIWLDGQPDRPRREGVAIVAGGTGDLPVAEEAALTLDLMGCAAQKYYDVGVAGLHRLLRHIPVLQQADVIIVIAGMDAALPSVVAGLVAAPVIAVPTSVGYGAAFGGIAPLLTMLNSCAAGVSVVNIDNGYGAGHIAAMMNRRIHAGVENAGEQHDSPTSSSTQPAAGTDAI